MNYDWVKNVCVMDSMHALLQYLLLVSEEEANNTFFFWSGGISSTVKSHFQNHYCDLEKNKHYYRTQLVWRYPFLLKNGIRYFGHDHLTFSKYILRKKNFELLEDGTLNYAPFPWRKKLTLKKKIRSLWAGPLYCMDVPYSGYESTCSRINLTGLTETGEVYSSGKVLTQTFQSLWATSSPEKRSYVNSIFGLSDKSLSNLLLSNKILLTQPLSEDGFLSEDEKISLFKYIESKIGADGLVIKPHPREKSNYRVAFPNAMVFDAPVPMQLITLNGVRFQEAYTLFSTAVFDFPYQIKVGYIGSRISKKLYERFPSQTKENCQINNPNVTLIDTDWGNGLP